MRYLEIGPSAEWGKLGPEWTTMDNEKFEYVDIVHDIHDLPLPVEDGTYNLIYMAHVIEHIHWSQTIDVLKDIWRILDEGGVLEIWTPDLDKILAAVINYESVPIHERKVPKDGRLTDEDIPQWKWINQKIFTYRHDPGKGGQLHESLFNPEFLYVCMQQAGFVGISALQKPRGPYPWYHGYCQFGISGIRRIEDETRNLDLRCTTQKDPGHSVQA